MQHVHDAADHPTVVDPVRPAATARQQRLDPRPFPIAQPIQLHHPSLPTTGSLNHETASRGIPELSTDPSRLLEEAKRSRDVTLRQNLAARALELAQQAEAIASFPNDVEGLRMRIAQYRQMLAGAGSEPKQRVVAELLRDAEDKFEKISSRQQPSRPHRVAAA
jgi:hypothetical protein